MKLFAPLVLLSLLPIAALAATGEEIGAFIIHHLVNGNEWHPLPGVNLHLPRALSLHALMLVVAALLLFVLFVVLYKKQPLKAPRGITNLLESLVVFVRNDICLPYLGERDGIRFAPFFLNFFFLILTLNLMGLVPLFATATSNINVTLGFALITFTLMVLGGLIKHGPLGFVKLFLPHGVPVFVMPILFPIELMGIFIKPFALTMRLFANMLGGHIVIFSLLGMIMIFKWAGTPSILLALFIYTLELLVAFIQAYVFTLLSAMFVGSMLHPAH